MLILIFVIAVFFAVNMGGASFTSAFAPAYGGRILGKNIASIIFLVFVVIGALLFGGNVSVTLGKDIIPPAALTYSSVAIIFFAASLSMFLGNVLRIPQSTSLVTVAAILGVGLSYGSIHWETIYHCLFFWLILPVLSFVLTYLIASCVYPPRDINFWVYERFVNQHQKLKWFVILTCAYNAFSVGTNNVANLVGPLLGGSDIPFLGLIAGSALVYGLGGFFFRGSLKVVGEQIVPLGLLTVSIISFVSATLMLIASAFGVPQSFVMLQMGALFAVSALKHGKEFTFRNPIVRKTFYTWTINPVLTFLLSYGLAKFV